MCQRVRQILPAYPHTAPTRFIRPKPLTRHLDQQNNVLRKFLIVTWYRRGRLVKPVWLYAYMHACTLPAVNLNCHILHERPRFGYYSLWLVVNKARMDIVLPACYTFQFPIFRCQRFVLWTQWCTTDGGVVFAEKSDGDPSLIKPWYMHICMHACNVACSSVPHCWIIITGLSYVLTNEEVGDGEEWLSGPMQPVHVCQGCPIMDFGCIKDRGSVNDRKPILDCGACTLRVGFMIEDMLNCLV